MPIRHVFAILICAVAVPPYMASTAFTQERADSLCVRADALPVPHAPAGVRVAEDCDAFGAYYAAGRRNLRAIRACALQGAYTDPHSVDSGDHTEPLASGVLAMIYAGGQGVAPNLPLAVRFACDMQDWEGDGRELGHWLEDQRLRGATRIDFDLCDHVIGRITNYECILRDQDRAATAVARAQARLNTGNAEQRAAFARLLAARKEYMEAHRSQEPNGTTGLVQEAMRDEVELETAWAQQLDSFAEGKLPEAGEGDFRKADAELNAAYRVALSKTGGCQPDPPLCLTTDELRQTERAWLRYRDAWVAYGELRWPQVHAAAWRTWLTRAQTADLQAIED